MFCYVAWIVLKLSRPTSTFRCCCETLLFELLCPLALCGDQVRSFVDLCLCTGAGVVQPSHDRVLSMGRKIPETPGALSLNSCKR